MILAIARLQKKEDRTVLRDKVAAFAEEQGFPWHLVFLTESNVELDLTPEEKKFVTLFPAPGRFAEIERLIEQKDPHQVVVLASGPSGRPLFQERSLIRHLGERFSELDIVVDEKSKKKVGGEEGFWDLLAQVFKSYALAFQWAAISLVTGYILSEYLGYSSIGSLFLLVILIFSWRNKLGPIVFFAALSCLGWYWWLVPRSQPGYSTHLEDTMFAVVSFLAACVIGALTHGIRKREKFLREHQKNLRFLYQITKDISQAKSIESCMQEIFPRIRYHLKGEASLILEKEKNLFPLSLQRGWWLNENENLDIAEWVFKNAVEAGLSTQKFSDAAALYIPMKGADEGAVGTFSFRPLTKGVISRETRTGLYAIARQLALFIERERYLENFRESVRYEESEKLHQTIFNSLSHELKTPITALRGFSSLFRSEGKKLNEDQVNLISEEIENNVQRLDRIVTQLLDSSRLESGKMRINPSWSDAEEIIDEAVGIQKKFSSVQFLVEVSRDLPEIYVDHHLISQCVENFIANAIQYGGVDQVIRVGAYLKAENMVFYVDDEGPGVSREHQPYLFERFFRIPGSPAGGSGLGLFLVKQIVGFHGGVVNYEKNRSGGSRFSFMIPLHRKKNNNIDSENELA